MSECLRGGESLCGMVGVVYDFTEVTCSCRCMQGWNDVGVRIRFEITTGYY